jgi:hypothetical protein
MKAKHKRSDTKIRSILSGRSSNADENLQTNINTVRTTLPEKNRQEVLKGNIRGNLTRNRSKFLSDDLYQQADNE